MAVGFRAGPAVDRWIGQRRRNVVALNTGGLHWTSVALRADAAAGSGAPAEYQRLGLL